ncbi:hypothetical protein DVA67_027430 [Solirubrobacter sp. CPCC 204708]|uniref:Integral membrane protein n=1 Tax=Solirubrobacter deserti TaxID=2282478 RepID=A0ABT4RG54_9ACTN|nr:hypothetical protein [Solirubrobacter deserti]MBE2319732.1 hypothetical protein [Solirubrobacter deserti]MDA0137528.1 hypothetical protein [Solirubrobacter deserti]
MRLLISAVVLAAVVGAVVLTGAETRELQGFCIDGPTGGDCVSERVVDWSGPLWVPIIIGAFVVLGLVLWLVRRATRWLVFAIAAAGIAVAFAVIGSVAL